MTTQVEMTQQVAISKIHTPEIIITATPKWLLNSIVDTAKKEKDNTVQEPIIVIKKGIKYFIIDKFELYEAALITKQKTIKISILNSVYDPLVAHIIATSHAKINPIRKIRAIRSMLEGSVANDLLAKTLRLDSYYSMLLGVYFTAKIESMLEKIIDHAISIGIANTEPLFKFFKTIKDSKNPSQIIENIYPQFEGCNKSNFFWSTVIAEIMDEPKEKKIGKDLPHDQKFDCKCGISYLISDGNKAEIMLEHDDYIQIMSVNGDISHPVNYFPEQLSKYIGSQQPVSFKFASLEDAVKKFKGKKFKVIVLADRDAINRD